LQEISNNFSTTLAIEREKQLLEGESNE